MLRSAKYRDHFDVIEKNRYVNGAAGAKCTSELKKKLRLKFQQPDDIQCFGYTAEEVARSKRFDQAFPDVATRYPLIEAGLTKAQCIGLLMREGIKIPAMYELGYHNNNCIGCVKGGAGYWNKIRVDFPDAFERMAGLERKIGHTCLSGVYLDELDERAGNHKDLAIQCDFICSMSEVFDEL